MKPYSNQIGDVITGLNLLFDLVADPVWARAHAAYDVDNDPAMDDVLLLRTEMLTLRYGGNWRTGERR